MKSLDNKRQETIEQLFGDILFSGKMTHSDRRRLRAALLRSSLSEDHLDIINRLLYSTKRGRLQIKD